jgi:hypothetical protein
MPGCSQKKTPRLEGLGVGDREAGGLSLSNLKETDVSSSSSAERLRGSLDTVPASRPFDPRLRSQKIFYRIFLPPGPSAYGGGLTHPACGYP